MSKPDNLFQRGDVWWILYYVGGKRRRESLETTKLSEAKKLRDQILGKRAGLKGIQEKYGIEIEQAAMVSPTLAQVAEKYLTACESRISDVGNRGETLRPSTAVSYRGYVNNWILPTLGQRRMSSIDCADVEAWLAMLKRRKLKADQHVFRCLRRIYAYAIRRKLYVGSDPTDIENKPTNNDPKDVVLTAAELGRILAELRKLDGQLYWQASVAALAGLRWGEVCGLKWEDVKLDGHPEIRCRRSYQGPLKNKASGKAVPISAELVGLLRQWQDLSGSDEWVFPSAIGKGRKRMSGGDRQAIWKAAADAKISKHVTPHVFRHTFGTLLYEATEDPKTVQRYMRHSNIMTTMRVYVKDDRDIRAKIDMMPALLPAVKLKLV